jgi:hypothetical protein
MDHKEVMTVCSEEILKGNKKKMDNPEKLAT